MNDKRGLTSRLPKAVSKTRAEGKFEKDLWDSAEECIGSSKPTLVKRLTLFFKDQISVSLGVCLADRR